VYADSLVPAAVAGINSYRSDHDFQTHSVKSGILGGDNVTGNFEQ